MLDAQLFRAIRLKELAGLCWTKPKLHKNCPNLLRLISHSNNVSKWVCVSIVSEKILKNRVKVFQNFVILCSVSFFSCLTPKEVFFFFFKPFCLHFLDFAEAEELSGDGVSRFGSLRGPCSQAQGHKKRLLAKDTETAKGDGNGD